MATSRIRVSLSAREIEVEGSEEFIAKYEETLDEMLQLLRAGKGVGGASSGGSGGGAGAAGGGGSEPPGEFGEVLHGLSSSATDTDKILLAGSFAQAASSDDTFTTGQANKLLLDQGIKVSNASQCLKNNLKAKRVFKVGNKYRVSKQGAEHLTKISS